MRGSENSMILVWSSPETLVLVRSVLPRSSLKCLSSPSLQRCMTTGSQRSANVCCSGKTWGSEERERGEKKKEKEKRGGRKTHWHSKILGQTVWDWKSQPRGSVRGRSGPSCCWGRKLVRWQPDWADGGLELQWPAFSCCFGDVVPHLAFNTSPPDKGCHKPWQLT